MKQEDYFKGYPGEWLLFFNEEIIDHSVNIEDMLRLAEEKYPADRFPDDVIKISKVLSGNIRLH